MVIAAAAFMVAPANGFVYHLPGIAVEVVGECMQIMALRAFVPGLTACVLLQIW